MSSLAMEEIPYPEGRFQKLTKKEFLGLLLEGIEEYRLSSSTLKENE